MKAKSKPVITIEQLYESLKYTQRKDDNLFEVAEVNEPFEELCDALPEEFKEHERLYNLLIDCIEQAERNAFHVGFSVAKGLLLSE
jgi:hypothetical protein